MSSKVLTITNCALTWTSAYIFPIVIPTGDPSTRTFVSQGRRAKVAWMLIPFNRIGRSLSLLGRRYVIVDGLMVTTNTKSSQVSNMHGRSFLYTVIVYCVDPTLRSVWFQRRIWRVSTNVHGHTFAYCNGWKHTKLCKSYFPCVHSPYSGTRNRRTIVAVRLGSFSTS